MLALGRLARGAGAGQELFAYVSEDGRELVGEYWCAALALFGEPSFQGAALCLLFGSRPRSMCLLAVLLSAVRPVYLVPCPWGEVGGRCGRGGSGVDQRAGGIERGEY